MLSLLAIVSRVLLINAVSLLHKLTIPVVTPYRNQLSNLSSLLGFADVPKLAKYMSTLTQFYSVIIQTSERLSCNILKFKLCYV